ncbi:MAG: phage tail tape measure protein [Candidatus Pacebacteria bacterium]|nr:phage tail tape measure protein [Candidatus Paceibacterota bacterium]
MKSATATVQKMSKSLKKLGKNLRDTGKTMTTRITAPIAALGVVSAMSFAKMEKGITSVFGLLTTKQIEKFGKQLKKAQKDAILMGYSIDDADKALFNIISSLGVSENSLKGYRDAQILAIAGDASLESSVLGIGKILNAYGKTTTDTARVAEAFFSAQVVGTTTVEELALNIGKVTGSANLAGLSLEEVLVTTSILTNVLRNTEEASTALANIIKVVTSASGKQAEKLNALGITTGITAVQNKGFTTVLKQVRNAMNKNKDALNAAIPEMRAFKGVASLTDESLKLLDDTVIQIPEHMKNGTGVMKAYREQMATMDRSLKKLGGSFKVLFSAFGEVMAPYIIKIAEGITKLANKFSKLSPTTKKIIIVILLLVSAIGPLLIMIGFMASGIALIGAASAPVIGTIVLIVATVSMAIVTFMKLLNLIKTKIVPAFKNVAAMMFDPFDKQFGIVKMGMDLMKNSRLGKMSGKVGEFFGNIKNKFSGNVDINVNAPRGAVKSISSQSSSNNFRLGTNMGM